MSTVWVVVSTLLIQPTCWCHSLDTATAVLSSSSVALFRWLAFFLTASSANSNVCHHNLSQMLSLCDRIGAPIKTEKVEGPTTRITFLGIVLDTVSMEADISSEYKASLLRAIYFFCTLKKCTKCELLSMIGKLSFACKVVPTGHIFLHWLIDLSCLVSKLHHHICITNEVCLDL